MTKIVIATLLLFITNAVTAETINLRCSYWETNPFAALSKSTGDLEVYFHLDLINQSAWVSHSENIKRTKTTTLFWNKNYIGLAEGSSSKQIPELSGVSSYLIDRKKGIVLFDNISPRQMNLENRIIDSNAAKLNGNLGNIIYRCARVGGF